MEAELFMEARALTPLFFDRDAQIVACDLIGKVLCHRVAGVWLMVSIVETEAYYRAEKASHASLGYSEKRHALFMAPGTVYMYYARGGDSFNVSCAGPGNAVLFKAGVPYCPAPGIRAGRRTSHDSAAMIDRMQRLNPMPDGRLRPPQRLCSGQTLLCRALGLRVPDWDRVRIGTPPLRLLDVGYRPRQLVRTTRLGIPPGRDGHLQFRFIDHERAASATRNPFTRRRSGERDFTLLPVPAAEGRPDWAGFLGSQFAQPFD